jgi:hypothetical protein
VVSGLDQSLELPAIGVTLSLAEIYHKVDFSAEPATATGTGNTL